MTIELTQKEQDVLKTLVNSELVDTINLIDKATGNDAKELDDHYNTLYIIRQKLLKEQ